MIDFRKFCATVFLSGLAGLTACGGGSASSGTGTTGTGGTSAGNAIVAGGAVSVYVLQQPSSGTNSVVQFTAAANGTVAATSTLNAPAGFSAEAVAIDTGGQIYIGGGLSGQPEILVYAAGSSGNATPLRTILFGTGNVYNPVQALAVDASGNLYVGGFSGTVSIYSSTANGAATPTRNLAGALTTLPNYYLYGLTADSTGNVYVAVGSSSLAAAGAVLVFGPTATGNVAPTRTITAAAAFYGVAVDGSGNLFATEDNFAGTAPATIVEFSASASGAATPTKTITLTGTTPSILGGIRLDSVGNLYAVLVTMVGTGTTATGLYSVIATGPGTTGVVAPAAQTSLTALSSPGPQLAIK